MTWNLIGLLAALAASLAAAVAFAQKAGAPSEPLDLKTTVTLGAVVSAVIWGLKYFAKWRTPEDARFDRGVRDELRREIERAQKRYDELLTKHDEAMTRIEAMHREILERERACSEQLAAVEQKHAEKIAEMEERMTAFIEARGVCDRLECPSRIDPNESGAFRRALRRESDENNHTKKGD